MKQTFILFLFLFLYGQVYAQHPLSNWRIKIVSVLDSTIIDSLLILPESVSLRFKNAKETLNKDFYKVNYNKIILDRESLFLNTTTTKDSLMVQYRVLPLDLTKTVAHLDTLLIEKTYKGDYIGFDYSSKNTTTTASLLNNSGLTYSGSFARGIAFGNNQSLVLNSSFNLQLAGQLGDETEIVAALTDENIPLQAEGNTQQLNDFDKIFIKIKRKNTSLTAGDYELGNPKGYFSRYYKKLQGATFEGNWELEKSSLTSQVSVAISRGKFARNIIIPQEGNQGPYKLQGDEGEQFIIILSGTEKIYIDGKLLSRGIESDYVIDYNRGELTFMNRQLITKDRRIIAEIEYVDQSFQRSLYAWNTTYKTDKLRMYLNIYSQQDSKNALGNEALNEEQKLQLQTVGDNLQNAFSSSIRPLEEEFNPARIQYELKDTFFLVSMPFNNQLDTVYANILVYATNNNSTLYTARFSEVEQGRGNYIQIAPSGANGRVYEWIAPDERGLPQGNFEPIQRLVAPKKQQLYTFGTEYQISEYANFQLETAVSNTDLNRLSDKDKKDNLGAALTANYQLLRPLGKKDWTIENTLNYEFVQKDFLALNPYRNAEFNRDWNIGFSNTLLPVNEHIGKGRIRLQQSDNNSFAYEFAGFFRDSLYQGRKHSLLGQVAQSGYALHIDASLLNTENVLEQTQFFRPIVDVSKTFANLKNWKIGTYLEREKNERFSKQKDTLNVGSFYWDIYKIYLENPEQNKFHWHLHYLKRYDYAPKSKAFLQSTIADEWHLNGHWQYQQGGQLKWIFAYRQLAIQNVDLTTEEARATYLGRLDYNLLLWRGALRWHTNYEIASGQEARTEFQFIKVNTGEGSFVWNPTEEYDLNGDSIPQINEFVVAPFRDQANYVRINTFTNDFTRTNNVLLNQSLYLTPRAIWQNKRTWQQALAMFSTLSNLRIIRKVQADGDVSVWNPLELDIAATSLVSVTSNIRNVLYFNQQNPVYDIELGQFDNRNRNLLTTGYETQKTAEQFLRGRWTINSQWRTETNALLGKRSRQSELFTNRDYAIIYQKIIPQVTYLPNNQWEMKLIYEYQQAKNQLPDNIVRANFNDFKMSLQYNKTQKNAFRSELSFIQIALQGEATPTLELSLLEGLKKGNNFLWNINMDRLLANNVQLSLRYEGRKTGSRKVVHLGSMQVRATF